VQASDVTRFSCGGGAFGESAVWVAAFVRRLGGVIGAAAAFGVIGTMTGLPTLA